MKAQETGCMERSGRHRGLLLGLVIMVATMFVAPAQAAIAWSFNYTDAGGVGFNAADPLGAARKTALAETATLVSNLFPTYTATIDMDVDGSETDDSTLAAAGSNFNSAAAATCVAGYNRGDVGLQILGGDAADPATGTADGTVTVNFEDVLWDLDDIVSPTLFDFKSTMAHELLHAVGFSHSVSQTGADGCGQAAPTAGGWVPYDEHLGDITANFITANVINTTNWTAAVTGGTGPTNGVLWRGPNGTAANGGNPVPLYSPTTFSPGSSVAHLDDDFFAADALLMEQATGAGPGTRTLDPREVGILKDIMFANAVPVELQSFEID